MTEPAASRGHWGRKRFLRKSAVLAFCLWAIAQPALADNSLVNLPVHHWVYDALSRLARTGLISSSFLSIQPIRRDEAARLVAEALKNRSRLEQKASNGFDWTDELLRRLEREFHEELEIEGDASAFRWRAVDTAELETMRAGLEDRSRHPLENSGGRSVSEGLNTRLSWRGWVQTGDWLALTLGAEVRSRDPDQDLFLTEGSLKLNLFSLDLEVGRDRQWWGPGEHGALLLSDNADPFDLIRIGNAHPSRLPFVLRRLGDWKWVVFVARLEHDRAFPRAKLGGARLVWAPIGWLELGASRTVIFGGHGAPHFTLRDFGHLLVGFGQDDDESRFVGNNNLGALDITVYLPFSQSFLPVVRGAKLYFEYGGEDNTPREFFWTGKQYKGLAAIAQLAGLSVSFARADIRLEYANNVDDGLVWYQTGRGYNFKDNVIGHEMGGDADDLSMQATVYLTPELHIDSVIERERAGLDRHRDNLQVVYGGQIGLSYSRLPEWEVSVRYRYEHIIRPEFIAGTEANTHLLAAHLEIHLIP